METTKYGQVFYEAEANALHEVQLYLDILKGQTQ
jgi:hypothetical protein